MGDDNSACEAAATVCLETVLGAKDTAWLTGSFMSAFGPQLLTVGVFTAEDLLLLTPQQALQICWSDSGRPFTVAKKRLQHLIQQIKHEHRLSAVLHRFGENISTLLSTCQGQHCYCERLQGAPCLSTPDLTAIALPDLLHNAQLCCATSSISVWRIA